MWAGEGGGWTLAKIAKNRLHLERCFDTASNRAGKLLKPTPVITKNLIACLRRRALRGAI
jgi:hypothetical protein